jgi:hypothetical protein
MPVPSAGQIMNYLLRTKYFPQNKAVHSFIPHIIVQDFLALWGNPFLIVSSFAFRSPDLATFNKYGWADPQKDAN